MTRFEATTAYWTMYIPSIMFGIGSTLMDLDQLDEIQKPLMHAILPKMGYIPKTCCHVVFGPPRTYLGIRASKRPCHRKRRTTKADVCQTYQIRPRPQQATSYRTRMVPTTCRYCQTNPWMPISRSPILPGSQMVPGTLRKFLYYYINAEINIDNLWVPLTLRATITLWWNLFLTHTTSQTPTCIDSTYAASISKWNFSRKSVTRKAVTLDAVQTDANACQMQLLLSVAPFNIYNRLQPDALR